METDEPQKEEEDPDSAPPDLPVMRPSFTTRDRSLLRASRASVVLGTFGAIFANSEGSAETYALSESVSSMDTFLSHNWSTPRFSKFLILAIHYNFTPALIISVLSMMTIGFLTAGGFLPLVDWEKTASEPASKTGFIAVIFGPVIFVASIVGWHEVAGRVGLMKAQLFLDKTCIHQVDQEKKRKGILSLAAFLERTDNMVIVYTSTYLRRLWTAFELASLLILYPEKRLDVVPTYLSRPLLIGMLFIHIGSISIFLSRLHTGDIHGIDMNTIASFLQGVFLTMSTRMQVWEKENIWSCAHSFSLLQAECAQESDRELVTRSVEDFLRQRQLVPEEASREAAVQVFDRMVHQKIPPKLLESTGAGGVPYKYLLVVFSPLFFRSVDWIGALWFEGAPVQLTLFCIALQLNIASFVLPLASALGVLLMEAAMPVKRWPGTVLRVGAGFSLCAFAVLCSKISSWLQSLFSAGHWRFATALLAAYILAAALSIWCLNSALTNRSLRHLRLGRENAPDARGEDQEAAGVSTLTASLINDQDQ